MDKPPLALVTNNNSNSPVEPSHLAYLDGLRGLAALYVVFHHAYMEVVGDQTFTGFPFFIGAITNWLTYGHVAVNVFIVLSGYCLMLPVARSEGRLRGGVRQYLFRRARRILPPYYAALVLSLFLIGAVPGMNQISGNHWDAALPAFTPSSIISHLLLIHNFKKGWMNTIDPPMWSVAIEWQIYFLFPALLLPVWRRFGNITTIAVAFCISLIPHLSFHKGDFPCPWFLGLFALGMVAAAINVSSPLSPKQLSKWSLAISTFTLTLFLVGTITIPGWPWSNAYIMDVLTGFATACSLVFFTNYCYHLAKSPKPFLLQLMASPYSVLLGTFSYSLYLVHDPVLSLFHLWIRPLHLSATQQLTLFFTVGTLLSLILSYIFHLLFERRFMSGSRTTLKQAAGAATRFPDS